MKVIESIMIQQFGSFIKEASETEATVDKTCRPAITGESDDIGTLARVVFNYDTQEKLKNIIKTSKENAGQPSSIINTKINTCMQNLKPLLQLRLKKKGLTKEKYTYPDLVNSLMKAPYRLAEPLAKQVAGLAGASLI